MPSTYARAEMLADPAWVADNYNRPTIQVLDCRWRVDGSGRRLHAEGHIPGATYVDWATQLVDPDKQPPYQLAPPGAVAVAMIEAGVGDGKTVVVLDDTFSLYASRVWWSLRAYGFAGVRLLDGGWPAWLDLGAPISTAASTVQPVVFTPGEPEIQRRVDAARLAELASTGSAQVIDARTPAEYLGQGGPGPRRGHIAGAINLPSALLVRDGGQALPSPSALSRLFAEAGVEQDRRTVVYDAVGVGAAKLAFCLELMGHDNVALYDGGWQEWAALPPEDYSVEAS